MLSNAPWPTATAEQLARSACYDCHSNETDWPLYSYVAPSSWLVRRDVEGGRDELNFSDWERFDGDADDAAEAIAEGSMPPSRYTLLHPDARLSDAEARQLIAALELITQIPMHKMPEVIPQLIDETQTWLEKKGVSPTDAPLIRYYVIDMENELDIEIGFPVADALSGDDRVSAGILPAGRYASLIYTDVNKGIEGNGVLIGWAKAQGIEWDAWDTEKGHAFRSRIEIFMDGPDDDPDPATWRTEVSIKIADD